MPLHRHRPLRRCFDPKMRRERREERPPAVRNDPLLAEVRSASGRSDSLVIPHDEVTSWRRPAASVSAKSPAQDIIGRTCTPERRMQPRLRPPLRITWWLEKHDETKHLGKDDAPSEHDRSPPAVPHSRCRQCSPADRSYLSSALRPPRRQLPRRTTREFRGPPSRRQPRVLRVLGRGRGVHRLFDQRSGRRHREPPVGSLQQPTLSSSMGSTATSVFARPTDHARTTWSPPAPALRRSIPS